MLNNRRVQLVTLATYHRVPAIYPLRVWAEAGGLMELRSPTHIAQAGVYTGRILKGEKPAELPVQAPTKYKLVVNLKTAKA